MKELQEQLKKQEAQFKNKEDEHFRKANEYEKLNALIEQKLQLTENEVNDLKSKVASKD